MNVNENTRNIQMEHDLWVGEKLGFEPGVSLNSLIYVYVHI